MNIKLKLMWRSLIVYPWNSYQTPRASSIQVNRREWSSRQNRMYKKIFTCRHGPRFLAFVILYTLKIILRLRYYFNCIDKEAKSEKSYNVPIVLELIPSRGWIQTQVPIETNSASPSSHNMRSRLLWTLLLWNKGWYVHKITNQDHVSDVKEIKYLKGLKGFTNHKTK